MKSVRRVRIGIAVTAESVIAVVRRGDIVHTESVGFDAAAGESAITAAFGRLRARVDAALDGDSAGAQVHTALLPPHAEARLLALPPLRPAEAAAVVRRDAGRYFLAVPAPRVTGVRVPPRSAAAPVLAAAAALQVVEAVYDATRQCGWRPGGVTAAHDAWIAAAAARGAAPRAIIAVDGATAHVIQLADGVPHALRRVPAAALDEIMDAAGAEPGAVAVYAEPPLRDTLAELLAARGWTPDASRRSAPEAAARHARDSALALVPVSAEAERRTTEHRLAARLAAATVLLLVGAAAVELWGAHRELNVVRARRAEIRAEVAPLLALRDSIDTLRARAGTVDAVASGTPRWTSALFDLAVLLPEEAYLTRLYTTGDTVVIEAEGARAGAALQALRGAGSLRDARLVGVVDRELADGATAVERFRISARLARPTAARVDPSIARGTP